MNDLHWISNINQLFRRPPGRLIGGVWGGGCPPRNQVKFRLLAAPGQYLEFQMLWSVLNILCSLLVSTLPSRWHGIGSWDSRID